jgi:ABC-type sulfate transport system substrate-binding protein
MRRPFFIHSAIVSLLGLSLLTANAAHAAKITLLNISYDPTRKLTHSNNPAAMKKQRRRLSRNSMPTSRCWIPASAARAK